MRSSVRRHNGIQEAGGGDLFPGGGGGDLFKMFH